VLYGRQADAVGKTSCEDACVADRLSVFEKASHGSRDVEPMDVPIGRIAIVEDPFGNRLVLLDSTKDIYDTERIRRSSASRKGNPVSGRASYGLALRIRWQIGKGASGDARCGAGRHG